MNMVQEEEMKKEKIVDDLDKRILEEYQKDATIAYRILAKKIDVPSSTVFSRIKQMKESGVIKGIIPLVDPIALGKTTTAWIQISLENEVDCCEFAEKIAKQPYIMEVYEIAGEWDILIKVKVEDNLTLHNYTKDISTLPGIRNMASIIAFKTVKEDPRIPL